MEQVAERRRGAPRRGPDADPEIKEGEKDMAPEAVIDGIEARQPSIA